MASSLVKFVLITQERCMHCVNVEKTFLPKYGERIAHIAPFKQIHLKKLEDVNKIPLEIKDHVKMAPRLYSIYKDGSFSHVNPLEIKKFNAWINETLDEAEERAGPKMTMLILVSDHCGACIKWKESGDYDKFVTMQKKRYGTKLNVEEFNTGKDYSKEPKKAVILQSLAGLPTPFVVMFPHEVMKEPNVKELRANMFIEVADPRDAEGRLMVQKWIDECLSEEGLKYYMVLSTSDGCPHCRNWKASGGQDEFKRKFSNIPGVVLIHNGTVPGTIRRKVLGVPSVMMVSKSNWIKSNPVVLEGPPPQDIKAVEEWLSKIMKQDKWSNDGQQLPDGYKEAPKKSYPRRQVISS